MNKYQYWKNGIMMGKVDQSTKEQIMKTARESGFKVYDNDHYFSVEVN